MVKDCSIQLENLTLQRGERLLVRDLSFQLNSGDALELRGANGSGKTTILRAIAGLHTPLSGKIILSGIDDALNKDYVSFLGHNDAIKANETVLHQLQFWAQMFDNRTCSITEIAKDLNLQRTLNLMGGVLSAGQKRRFAIARTIISNRPIWLLDEPAAPLDAAGRELLGTILDKHRKSGGIIIAAVHDALPGKGAKCLYIDAISQTVSQTVPA